MNISVTVGFIKNTGLEQKTTTECNFAPQRFHQFFCFLRTTHM